METPFKTCVARLLSLITILGFVVSNAPAFADAAKPHRKPARTIIKPGYETNRIAVKFRDGLNVRLRNGVLVSTNASLFADSKSLFDSLSAGKWHRADQIPEEAIDDMRHRAEERLGRALPDGNLQFYLALPQGMDAAKTIDELNKLDIVDLAQPVPRAMRPPLPPNFQPQQTYNDTAPIGGGVFDVWTDFNIFGANIRIADVEYSYNSNHLDLPAVTDLSTNGVDPFYDDNHGTATLGEMSALQNGWGTTGIAYDASYYFAAAQYDYGYDVGAGITTAASQLREGDILLVEQQITGPNTTQGVEDTGGEYGLVPVDWFEPYYNDVVMATGLGIIVIETADNGGQNLDDPIYSTGNGGLWPFLPQNRSGAIFVGAGAAYNGSATEGSRLDFANYGSCIDVQNWGENIVTTGYGDLYSAEGPTLYYTSTFGGTSAATPIVVGEAALLQSIYENSTGQLLTASQMRALLRNTGTAQTWGGYPIYDDIGPRPNLAAAIQTALANTGAPTLLARTTNATALIGGTAGLSIAMGGEQPLSYQWHFNDVTLVDGTNVSGSATADMVLINLTPAQAGTYSVIVNNMLGTAQAECVLAVISDPSVPPGATMSNVYTFTYAYDGGGPIGVTPDGLGNLYLTVEYGGTNGYGSIDEFTPATGDLTVMWSFTNGVDGAYPFTPLTLGDDGTLYGTTQGDGSFTFGSIFSIDSFGNFTVLYSFAGGDDGSEPQGTLLLGSNGLFYGTTYAGGTENQGVVFTVDTSGNENVIHDFDYTDGAGPYGGLVPAGDGYYYGTTSWGGTHGLGTIYRFNAANPRGAFSSLLSFNGVNGQNPSDNLAVGLDGKLYGTTYFGGSFSNGTVFSFTTNGVFKSLFSFNGANGQNPHASLLAGNDGNLYGVTTGGGTNAQNGVIFEVTPNGAFDIVAEFNGDDGNSGFGPMVRNIDGNFYGTTFNGAYGDGNIYELSFTSTPAPAFVGATPAGKEIVLTCGGTPGRAYQLQSTTNLSQSWTPAGGFITASNAMFTVSDTLLGAGQKFYRLEEQLP